MEKLPKGFYKVAQDGGCYISATFYNPDTKESKHIIIDDTMYASTAQVISIADETSKYITELFTATNLSLKAKHASITTPRRITLLK